MRHQLASVHELMRIPGLAGLPGETLGRLAERMDRRELHPGEEVDVGDRFAVVLSGMARGGAILRAGDEFTGRVTAVTPAAVASCDRSVLAELGAELR